MAPVAEKLFNVEVAPNQAVWPSNSPVLGIFFACCGVIFAVSWPPGTPRGPSILRAISSSVNRCSSSRTWRGIGALHGALVNVLASFLRSWKQHS
jgi:hypothetical protein